LKYLNTLKDRIRGSLIGGAIGDALGYPVEFIYSFEGIQARYGEKGITRLDTHQHWLEEEQTGKAVFSDDTQMTLYTVNGLLNARRQNVSFKYGICRAYIEWYLTQIGKKSGKYHDCWISDVPALNARRAPGNTCMTALDAIYRGKEPQNNSKGCGGVMRIAPIPLYGAEKGMSIEEVDLLAGEAAELTHLHPLGFIPAALMAHIIYRLALDDQPSREGLIQYIREGMDWMKKLYPQYPVDLRTFEDLIERAIMLSYVEDPDVHNIELMGGGWVGDEALAIAFYCALKHFDNFEEAMIAAVNHAGDSDSTGAVIGNILGAAIGYEAIPQFFKDDLEMHDLILHMADDLFSGEVTKMDKGFGYMDNFEELVFPRKPIRNSYMVMDRVYAGEYPRDLDETKSMEKIKQFERFGITHFVDLTEEGELRPYSQMLGSCMQHIRFPIKDVCVPKSTESVKELIKRIKEILKANERNKVYIHCWGGVSFARKS
jgi:ADP-ribosylglycohydrolase